MPAAPLALWFRSSKFRRAFALSAVVVATGGLVLYRTPDSSGFAGSRAAVHAPLAADGKNAVAFRGPGARGVLSLSHTSVAAGQSSVVYAELKLVADAADPGLARAPISLAVVLDTSGSMGGEKIEDAKRSVLRLLDDMQDEDEIAVVRYSDTSELLQPLARVGRVRSSLTARIRELSAGGGTNIPAGLSHGLRELADTSRSRVRRIVLVSDGLDGTRTQAEALARSSFSSGITVSSLGIGLDFDEAYMGAVAQTGHGNFAFIKDGGSLASFLKRELEQTAATMIENTRVRIKLPSRMRFVSATGADATYEDGEVDLRLGSVFAGDERRVIIELSSEGTAATLSSTASWNRVGETGARSIDVAPLRLFASSDPAEVERGRDGAVFASVTSVLAAKRQLEASNAYASGDIARATALTTQNAAELKAALAAAPAAAQAPLTSQLRLYEGHKAKFKAVHPESSEGKALRKAGAMSDLDNLNRAATY